MSLKDGVVDVTPVEDVFPPYATTLETASDATYVIVAVLLFVAPAWLLPEGSKTIESVVAVTPVRGASVHVFETRPSASVTAFVTAT